MLVTEDLDEFVNTYSDAGKYILQKDTGIEYVNAYDLKGYEHEYTETDHDIEVAEEDATDDWVDYI